MSNFKMSFSDIDPSDRNKAKLRIISWPNSDIFSSAGWLFSGLLRFEDDQKFVEVKLSAITNFLGQLMKMVFAMNFYRPAENTLELSGSFRVKPHTFSHQFKVRYSIVGSNVEFHVHTFDEYNSSERPYPNDGMKFVVPIFEFNQAIWSVYNDITLFLEDVLGDIDGFEDRFCSIPFRGEQYRDPIVIRLDEDADDN